MSDTIVLSKKATKKSSVPHAHDNAFQSAMSDIRVARDFFEHHLPEVVRKQIDLNTLRMHPTTFVDRELRKLASDVLYSVEFNDRKNQAFLYTLIEHQSTPDKLMPLRIIHYICRILDHYTKQHRPKTPLPVVIPLVFYNGDQLYPYSCSIFDLFGEHKTLAKQFMFDEFKLVDLNQIPDEEIRQHQWSGLLEMLFKHITARDIIRHLEALNDIVDELVQSKADDYLMTMLKYVIEKSDMTNRAEFYDWVHHHLSPPLEEKTVTTLAQQWKAEGRQEGIQQGKLEGEQTLLMKLLYRRFPTLARKYEMHVKNARTEELLLWGERILDAKSVDEVFEV